MRSNTANKKRIEFAICVANEGYDDLQVWRVYQVLPDSKALAVGCVRVIDESGEDYLYPADRFVAVSFPSVVRAKLPRWQPSEERRKLIPTATRGRQLSA